VEGVTGCSGMAGCKQDSCLKPCRWAGCEKGGAMCSHSDAGQGGSGSQVGLSTLLAGTGASARWALVSALRREARGGFVGEAWLLDWSCVG